MTSFTKIADSAPASISVNASHKLSKINDNIYGGFIEHMGRCIYGGVYDPGNPLSDEDGFRKDFIQVMKDLKAPVMRYPGGNFTATYHWLDGVGPKDQRPSRPELAWLGRETNQFGTDEFMKWCKVVGTEPFLCFNFGTGTLDEALAWLEYCNSDRDTYYANLRRKNGHEAPYNVKYWALGNETYGKWQVLEDTKESYAKKAYQWAKAIKMLDPSVQLVLCGEKGYDEWDEYVLKYCLKPHISELGGDINKPLISMHSIHAYTRGATHNMNATAPRNAERAIQICASLIDYARITNNIPSSVPQQQVCFDEWNAWDPKAWPGEEGAEQIYDLSDALAVAVWLNVFVRQSKYVGMANIAQSANVLSPIITHKDGLVKQSIWHPLWLFSNYMRGHTVAAHVCCGEYEGDTEPAWVRGAIETPWLDVSSVLADDGTMNLAVVNIHESTDFTVDLSGVKEGAVEVNTVTGNNVKALNSKDQEGVTLKTSSWDGKGKFTFGKHSFTLLRWKTAPARFNVCIPCIPARSGTPLPSVAAMAASGAGMNNFATLIKRLDAATSRLEDIATSITQSTPSTSVGSKAVEPSASAASHTIPITSPSGPSTPAAAPSAPGPVREDLPASVTEFDTIVKDDLDHFDKISQGLGGLALDIRKVLLVATKAKKPAQDSPAYADLLSGLQQGIGAVMEIRDKNRKCPQENHLAVVGEGVSMLAWVTIEPKPADYIGDVLGGAQLYGPGGDMSSVFADLNRGEAVTSGLKKVDKSQMTHKNPSLRASAAESPSPSVNRGKSPTPNRKPDALKTKKPCRCELDGNKWLVEHYDQNDLPAGQPIEIQAEKHQSILITRCKATTVKVIGKANAISIDNCSRLDLLVESLVSTVDVVNAANFRLQILGTLPSISLDKVDGATVFLSKDSLATEVYSSKCTSINITLPPAGDDDDSVECPVPEQIKTWVENGKLMNEIVKQEG
ncbi:hypothetical protein FH972_021544 [Carpinus fangiana]|uniref:non-reducing end alpha-L-arabinofuranosidase n=1 Tax=Carpinus fangiana TaxID=176857 RepID=A0A5N6KPL2_9ROSI|nr:hypothetical protein FH972_021544 [Carpinus fangiana]